MIEVVYGIPDSVPTTRLLRALAKVANAFNADPQRMLAVLGPPGRGARWFTFSSTSFGRGWVMTEGHFIDVMSDDLPELFLASRTYGEESPQRFRARGFELRLDGTRIGISGELPSDARRDGDVDQIGLGALGLEGAIRPFAAIAAPTHEVVLRSNHARPGPDEIAITPFGGAILSVGVEPGGHQRLWQPDQLFVRAPRIVAVDDDAELAAIVEAGCATAEDGSIQTFERKLMPRARALALAGVGIVPLLVDKLTIGTPRPRTARLAMATLGLLADAEGAVVLVRYAAKASETMSLAGYCALAAHGETARGALVSAGASRKAAERRVGHGLLPLLQDSDWAPIRAVRAARDAEARPETWRALSGLAAAAAGSVLRREVISRQVVDAASLAAFMRAIGNNNPHEIYEALGPLYAKIPDAGWAIALHLIETPLEWSLRCSILQQASDAFGKDFGVVADVLLRFPPFADDIVIGAIARGVRSERGAFGSVEYWIAVARKKAKPKPKKATKRS